MRLGQMAVAIEGQLGNFGYWKVGKVVRPVAPGILLCVVFQPEHRFLVGAAGDQVDVPCTGAARIESGCN